MVDDYYLDRDRTPLDVKGDNGEAMLFVPVSVHIDQAPLMVV